MVGEWQPISTAPKDESDDAYILAFEPAHERARNKRPHINAVHFKREVRWERDRFASDENTDVQRKIIEEWWETENGMISRPTHWMPLPTPPTEGGE